MKQRGLARVLKQGNSLVIPLTKELRRMGITEGMWIAYTINNVPDDVIIEAPVNTSFDPKGIGDRILKSINVDDWDNDQLIQYVEALGVHGEDATAVLIYVRSHS